MLEDRLSDKQAVKLAALQKSIDSFRDEMPPGGKEDVIIHRAERFEKYLLSIDIVNPFPKPRDTE